VIVGALRETHTTGNPGGGEWDSISGIIEGTIKMTIVFRKVPVRS